MNWNADYELILRDMGVEPYGCLVDGCDHVSGGTFRQMIHYRFGTHGSSAT